MSRAGEGAGRVVATGGLMLATLMTGLDTTIANVALPHIQGSLSAAQDQITWVLTSYMVGTAIMTPLTGWLSRKLGRKPLFLLSIVGFTAVSVLCGVATSLPEIMIFRLLQGFAGAAMIPLSQAAVLDLWPKRAIPQVMAVWSAVVTVAPILGPTLGGFLTENFSWRWVFYINVPIGVLAFAMVFSAAEIEDRGEGRPFDWLGFGALVLFTTASQLLVDRGPSQDWFDSREIWCEAIIAACAFHVFITQTLTSEHPLFHRDIFRDRNFASSLIFSFVVSAVLFSTSALLPTLMQNLLGYSVMQSGVTSAPRGVGAIVSLAFVPWMAMRFGPRRTMAGGLLLSVFALWLMGHFDLAMTAQSVALAGFIQGVGQGMIQNPLTVLSFATLSQSYRTEAAVFGNMLRTLGGGLGIAGLQAILTRQAATAHELLSAHIIPSDPVIAWSLPPLSAGGGLETVNAEVSRQAAMIGYDAAFGWMSVGVILLLPLLLVMHTAEPRSSEMFEALAD